MTHRGPCFRYRVSGETLFVAERDGAGSYQTVARIRLYEPGRASGQDALRHLAVARRYRPSPVLVATVQSRQNSFPSGSAMMM